MLVYKSASCYRQEADLCMEFTADELKKFWSHVDKTGDEGCWNWKGHKKSSKYYGIFHYRKKTPGAHRISYAIHHNEDISDKHIHHICENRGCVNPDHLEALLPIDHMRKTPQSNAYCALTTNTCIHGHAFIGDNVYYYPNGSRACRECIRRLGRDWHRKKFEGMPKVSAKLRGVQWNRCMQQWRSAAHFQSKKYHLGYFDTEIDAHEAYLSWMNFTQELKTEIEQK